jgi:hypothetical protein
MTSNLSSTLTAVAVAVGEGEGIIEAVGVMRGTMTGIVVGFNTVDSGAGFNGRLHAASTILAKIEKRIRFIIFLVYFLYRSNNQFG